MRYFSLFGFSLLLWPVGPTVQPSMSQVNRSAPKPSGRKSSPSRENASTKSTFAQRKEAQEEFLITLAQFLEGKNVPAAKAGFLRVIKIDPTYPQPRFNLAVLAESEANKEEAIKWFNEYLSLDSRSSYAKDARARLARLRLTSATGDEERKRQQYNDYIARARRLIKAGFLKEAIAEFDQAAKLDDTRWEAYAMTAVLLTHQGLLPDAKEFEERARQRTPSDKKPALEAMLRNNAQERQYREYSQSALKAFRSKNYIRAAEDFSRAWQLFPQRSESAFAAAVAFTAGKDYVETTLILNRLKTNPDPEVARKAERMLQALTARK